MNSQYIIYSQPVTTKDKVEFTAEDKKHYITNALIIESVLNTRNIKAQVVKILIEKYFIQYLLGLNISTDAQEIVSNKENFKLSVPTPYVQIRYPIDGHFIKIEVPNYYPKDIKIQLNIKNFKLFDFQFLKALNLCRENKGIDMILLQNEIDNIDSYTLNNIVDFIEKEHILEKDNPNYGKYWYKWREGNKR